jgi:hypothetical protein
VPIYTNAIVFVMTLHPLGSAGYISIEKAFEEYVYALKEYLNL